MSDLMNHGRTDLVEFPSDSPQPGDAYVSPFNFSHAKDCRSSVSGPVCSCRPIRTPQQAARDILRRQLVASEAMTRNNVVELAAERVKRLPLMRRPWSV